MTVNVVDGHNEHRERKHAEVDGDQKGDGHDRQRLKDGLDRVERKGGPRRWVRRAVMHEVHGAVDPRMMHRPMGPVEVGVMKNEDDPDTEYEPGPAVLADFPIDEGVLPKQAAMGYERHGNKNAEGEHRVADLATIVARARPARLELRREPPLATPTIEDERSDAGHEHITRREHPLSDRKKRE